MACQVSKVLIEQLGVANGITELHHGVLAVPTMFFVWSIHWSWLSVALLLNSQRHIWTLPGTYPNRQRSSDHYLGVLSYLCWMCFRNRKCKYLPPSLRQGTLTIWRQADDGRNFNPQWRCQIFSIVTLWRSWKCSGQLKLASNKNVLSSRVNSTEESDVASTTGSDHKIHKKWQNVTDFRWNNPLKSVIFSLAIMIGLGSWVQFFRSCTFNPSKTEVMPGDF